jgi:hypothetical protein
MLARTGRITPRRRVARSLRTHRQEYVHGLERLLTVSATAPREIPVERAAWQLAVRVVDPSPREAFARCAERLNALAERRTRDGGRRLRAAPSSRARGRCALP